MNQRELDKALTAILGRKPRKDRGVPRSPTSRLRMALNTAIRWRLVSVNVATVIDAPRSVAREIRPLNPESAKALLAAACEYPLEGFVAVALGCGLRLGEALGLRWTDLDLDSGTLRVCRAVQRFGGDTAARRPLLSCATFLLAQGVNPRVVMETLGHSQVSLTLNTYSHVLPSLQQDAAARINRILGGS